MKKKTKIISFILIIIFILTGAVVWYINDYYRPAQKASALCEEHAIINAFVPKGDIKAGIILYPGAKVECISYAPLMEELAKQGYLGVIVHMPANLAFFDKDAASDVISEYSEVDRWYIAGHSLGGVVAASYISEHSDEYQGLIMLASYSVEDLTGSGIDVLSIYGTEDRVLNKNAYLDNIRNLPSNYTEVQIDGGNHAQFGCYGEQKGDGTASISEDKQIELTVGAINDFINNE